MDPIRRLSNNVELLLQAYQLLEQENFILQRKMTKLEEKLTLLKTQNATLKSDLALLQAGEVLSNTSGQLDALKSIDSVIGEIDKMIEVLKHV